MFSDPFRPWRGEMAAPSTSEMSNGQLLFTALTHLEVLTDQISPDNVLDLLAAAVDEMPSEAKGASLYTATLDNKQWEAVNKMNRDLSKEYALRSELLLKRLDVTVDSFMWSEKGAHLKEDVMKTYAEAKEKIGCGGEVELSDLIAATTAIWDIWQPVGFCDRCVSSTIRCSSFASRFIALNLLVVDKTSSSTIRTRTQNPLTKFLLKEKPADRGGRTNEVVAPEPEVPSWKRRGDRGGGGQRGGPGGGQGGRGRGDHRRKNFENQVKDQIRQADRRAHGYTEVGGPNVGPFSGRSNDDSRQSKRGRHH
ncbi:hypothetical protein L596_018534 [Steinernema carpocapsae]|uniref:Uncharacterized protein n=1 Tax=Steinernema carpocapsae TaxID=34508 RepID=A0A4U5N4Z0_STECR|nr:hypothetical protein L596_018534 [Steinernema carpocapsae]